MRKSITIVTSILVSLSLISTNGKNSASEENPAADTGFETTVNSIQMNNASEYEFYLSEHTSDNRETDTEEYEILAADYAVSDDPNLHIVDDFKGKSGKSLETGETGSVSWDIDIKEAGLYTIHVEYYPIEGKSASIQRSILINGEIPYVEAVDIEFPRFWIDSAKSVSQDSLGNDIRPSQVEIPEWTSCMVYDSRGYYNEPLRFYLNQGVNRITLTAQREPMILDRIILSQIHAIPDYANYISELDDPVYAQGGEALIIEAENASRKTSPMLYPVADHTSPSVEPYSYSKIKMNTIGGWNWRFVGQQLTWQVDVPLAGLYRIGMNVRQDFVRGTFSARKLLLNGDVPFTEASDIRFLYHKGWEQMIIADASGAPYWFYLAQGMNTISLEVTLGGMADILRQAEASVADLNTIYRQIIMITGKEPDVNRDYQIAKSIPGIVDRITAERDRVAEIISLLREIAGTYSDKEAILITLYDQLDDLSEDVEKVIYTLESFKSNIGSLAAWLNQAKEMPLQIDRIYILPSEVNLPEVHNSLIDRIGHEIMSLIYSFIIDYNSVGSSAMDYDREITVWSGAGRDQANTIRAMIDEGFSESHSVKVDLMLVDMAGLLPAVLAGQGPDVALHLPLDLPMNYGMRNAVYDIASFKDFGEIKERFLESAMIPFTYKDKVYALPEQQTFNMLFYRTDILQQLGLEVPQTWDDVHASLSVLSRNYLEFGMIPSNLNIVGYVSPDSVFGIFLYQAGGQFYSKDGKTSLLDTETALNAFLTWTEFYIDYGLEKEFDFVNRFRTGEMPIGISDYTTYNILQVAAPEIKGLWDFGLVPGTKKADGTIVRTIPSGGLASIMLRNTKDREASWNFLKWWTSAEAQTRFGRELESLMGPSARYPTANMEALSRLPWPADDYNTIMSELENVVAIPQVPGGYLTNRHLNNAFYTAVNGTIAPREALKDQVRYINEEIEHKRREFKLDD